METHTYQSKIPKLHRSESPPRINTSPFASDKNAHPKVQTKTKSDRTVERRKAMQDSGPLRTSFSAELEPRSSRTSLIDLRVSCPSLPDAASAAESAVRPRSPLSGRAWRPSASLAGRTSLSDRSRREVWQSANAKGSARYSAFSVADVPVKRLKGRDKDPVKAGEVGEGATASKNKGAATAADAVASANVQKVEALSSQIDTLQKVASLGNEQKARLEAELSAVKDELEEERQQRQRLEIMERKAKEAEMELRAMQGDNSVLRESKAALGTEMLKMIGMSIRLKHLFLSVGLDDASNLPLDEQLEVCISYISQVVHERDDLAAELDALSALKAKNTQLQLQLSELTDENTLLANRVKQLPKDDTSTGAAGAGLQSDTSTGRDQFVDVTGEAVPAPLLTNQNALLVEGELAASTITQQERIAKLEQDAKELKGQLQAAQHALAEAAMYEVSAKQLQKELDWAMAEISELHTSEEVAQAETGEVRAMLEKARGEMGEMRGRVEAAEQVGKEMAGKLREAESGSEAMRARLAEAERQAGSKAEELRVLVAESEEVQKGLTGLEGGSDAAASMEVEDMRWQLEDLNQLVEGLRVQLEEARGEASAYSARLAEAEDSSKAARQQLEGAMQESADLRAKLGQSQQEGVELQAKIDEAIQMTSGVESIVEALQSSQSEQERLQNECLALMKEVQKLQGSLLVAEGEKERLMPERDELQERLTGAEAENLELWQRLTDASVEKGRLGVEIKQLEAQLAEEAGENVVLRARLAEEAEQQLRLESSRALVAEMLAEEERAVGERTGKLQREADEMMRVAGEAEGIGSLLEAELGEKGRLERRDSAMNSTLVAFESLVVRLKLEHEVEKARVVEAAEMLQSSVTVAAARLQETAGVLQAELEAAAADKAAMTEEVVEVQEMLHAEVSERRRLMLQLADLQARLEDVTSAKDKMEADSSAERLQWEKTEGQLWGQLQASQARVAELEAIALEVPQLYSVLRQYKDMEAVLQEQLDSTAQRARVQAAEMDAVVGGAKLARDELLKLQQLNQGLQGELVNKQQELKVAAKQSSTTAQKLEEAHSRMRSREESAVSGSEMAASRLEAAMSQVSGLQVELQQAHEVRQQLHEQVQGAEENARRMLAEMSTLQEQITSLVKIEGDLQDRSESAERASLQLREQLEASGRSVATREEEMERMRELEGALRAQLQSADELAAQLRARVDGSDARAAALVDELRRIESERESERRCAEVTREELRVARVKLEEQEERMEVMEAMLRSRVSELEEQLQGSQARAMLLEEEVHSARVVEAELREEKVEFEAQLGQVARAHAELVSAAAGVVNLRLREGCVEAEGGEVGLPLELLLAPVNSAVVQAHEDSVVTSYEIIPSTSTPSTPVILSPRESTTHAPRQQQPPCPLSPVSALAHALSRISSPCLTPTLLSPPTSPTGAPSTPRVILLRQPLGQASSAVPGSCSGVHMGTTGSCQQLPSATASAAGVDGGQDAGASSSRACQGSEEREAAGPSTPSTSEAASPPAARVEEARLVGGTPMVLPILRWVLPSTAAVLLMTRPAVSRALLQQLQAMLGGTA